MEAMSFWEFAMHALAFIAAIAPALILFRAERRAGGNIPKAVVWLALGFLPMAGYHFIECLAFFGLGLLPAEGSAMHIALDHAVDILALLAFTGFLLWFNNTYVEPIYPGAEEKRPPRNPKFSRGKK